MGQGMKGVGGLREGEGERKEERTVLFSGPSSFSCPVLFLALSV